jgi:hypothetical protein
MLSLFAMLSLLVAIAFTKDAVLARKQEMRVAQALVVGLMVSLSTYLSVCPAQSQPSGVVVDSRLGNGLLVTHTNDPTQDFNAARQSFLDLDVMAAAARIRSGAQKIHETLASARDDSRQAMQDSVTELESMARATEQRMVGSVRQLDESFARANYALAQRHYLAALLAREQMAQARVGEELDHSAEYLQRATQQVGLWLRDDETADIDRTRALGSNLRAGVAASSDEIAREMQLLSQSLANMRDRLYMRTASTDGPVRR